ncbi:MAG TPA: sigma-70 family RNA polymerase sigma factor, partial [Candidatus Acidoferrales bacterium]|nr:sigma-70 family RNA polymerase sigma factor [Candidatus Acidoferrales bacterium]
MMTVAMTPCAVSNDAELVNAALGGNRDAFGQIVTRYQSLICSLAYSATGSLGQSEDLAQETFITAWKHLAHLRERDKLRSWLCGIARNRINSFLRREGREPVRVAEPLENVSESHACEPLPVDETITNEEAAILWRSIERIPEIYREPLILFYREHQSVEAVAARLDLSEEAVKQRLSRGRKMLHKQILAFVEGALERTSPGKAFTLGVIAALPFMSATAKAAGVGAAAAKGGALAKATGVGAKMQSLLKFFGPLGAIISLGGWLGYKMGGDAAKSQPQRESVGRFWNVVAAGLVVFVFLPLLLGVPLMLLLGSKENFLAVCRAWLDILFLVVVAAFGLWVWQRRKARPEASAADGKVKILFVWSVVLATLMAAAVLALGLSDSNFKVERIPASQAEQIIAAHGREAQIFVMRFFDHSAFKQSDQAHDELWIEVEKDGQVVKYITPADQSLLSLLAQQGIEFPTYVQGRDFDIYGAQGHFLLVLCIVVLAAGIAVLLTLSLKNKSKTPIMTSGTKIGIVATIVVAALIVTPLVWLNHRKVNTVRPNYLGQSGGAQARPLTPEQSTQARQTANDFFAAMGKADWRGIDKLCPPGYALSDMLNDEQKNQLAGVELVSLGEPFKKEPYPGVFVPYEIRF